MNTQITNTTRDWLTSDTLKQQIAQALPKGDQVDKFLRCLYTQVQKNPKLGQCSKETLYTSMITCAQLGMYPDGMRAYLIPYKSTCTLIIGYKGLVELVTRSGEVTSIHADVVCDNDIFEVNMGLVEVHKIDYRKPRGKAYAAYAIARFSNGQTKAEVMTAEEIDKIRNSSPGKDSEPWTKHTNEMWKKTAFRRLAKWLPLCDQARAAIEADDRQYEKPVLEDAFATDVEVTEGGAA